MNTKHKIPRLARMLALTLAIFVTFGILFLMLGQSSRGSLVAADRMIVQPTVQQPGVLPTLTPQPTSAPTNAPTAQATSGAPKPANTPAAAVCPAGSIPQAAKGKFFWLENPAGSNKFAEYKVAGYELTGLEKLMGSFKTMGENLFCLTDRDLGGNKAWWKK